MVVVGVLLGLNIRRRDGIITPENAPMKYWSDLEPGYEKIPSWQYGWPADMATVGLVSIDHTQSSKWLLFDKIPPWGYWNSSALAINIAVFVCLVSLTLFSSEWFIRRRDCKTK